MSRAPALSKTPFIFHTTSPIYNDQDNDIEEQQPDQDQASPLKERVCLHWKMIPGAIALAACVIALFCCLLWECPYLCIPFVTGGIASGICIYMGYEFQNLQSFTENNRDYAGLNQTLQERINELKNEISHFSGVVDKLEKANAVHMENNEALELKIGELEEIRTALQKETDTLKAENGVLQGHLEDLNKLKLGFKSVFQFFGESALSHVDELKALQVALSKDHKNIGEKFEALQAAIRTVAKVELNSQDTLSGLLDMQRKIAESDEALKNTLAAIKLLTEEGYIQKLFEQQESMLKEIGEITKQQREISETIVHYRATAAELGKHVSTLQVMRDNLNKSVEALTGQLEALGKRNVELEGHSRSLKVSVKAFEAMSPQKKPKDDRKHSYEEKEKESD